jgi:hypothetical protein
MIYNKNIKLKFLNFLKKAVFKDGKISRGAINYCTTQTSTNNDPTYYCCGADGCNSAQLIKSMASFKIVVFITTLITIFNNNQNLVQLN